MTWYTFLSYLRNRLKGKRWKSFHSPFLFRLFSYMGDEQVKFEKFAAIEILRKKWLHTNDQIVRQDFGSGSSYTGKQKTERISMIAKQALSLPFQCRCMARLVQMEKPAGIVEFGTSLGISAAYLQSGNPHATITTIEGDPELGRLASFTFTDLGMNEIQLIISTFENYLDVHRDDTSSIDMLFLDGNHRSEALLFYYDQLKNRFSSNTIVMVDDIYWSKDMQEGWRKLIAMPEVTQSVDCFQFGILFFRNEFLEKEHHLLQLPIRALLR